MDEIVAAGAVVKAVVARTRRSHNSTTADGGPLINDNEPDNAGLPPKGKIAEHEATFVRSNLQLVNERRTAAGHPPINPPNPLDAKRYGFPVESQLAASNRRRTSALTRPRADTLSPRSLAHARIVARSTFVPDARLVLSRERDRPTRRPAST
jgi:hypothetical protein